MERKEGIENLFCNKYAPWHQVLQNDAAEEQRITGKIEAADDAQEKIERA